MDCGPEYYQGLGTYKHVIVFKLPTAHMLRFKPSAPEKHPNEPIRWITFAMIAWVV